jgi:hypothetical protein
MAVLSADVDQLRKQVGEQPQGAAAGAGGPVALILQFINWLQTSGLEKVVRDLIKEAVAALQWRTQIEASKAGDEVQLANVLKGVHVFHRRLSISISARVESVDP